MVLQREAVQTFFVFPWTCLVCNPGLTETLSSFTAVILHSINGAAPPTHTYAAY